ncbi:hypothetical protein LNP05_16830 [Klebsiella pneumoniae subsp. pneumoniae]|nr:hypothetical protein [Klebsiella pneumoniae subsp. pneumoniae]
MVNARSSGRRSRLRRCRPLGQQLRLLAATGGNEVVRLRGLRPPWQQGQQ